jgi:hypothetical protein
MDCFVKKYPLLRLMADFGKTVWPVTIVRTDFTISLYNYQK